MTSIPIPIWLFILFIIFGFIGLVTLALIIYIVISSLMTPDYIYIEEEEYGNKEN